MILRLKIALKCEKSRSNMPQPFSTHLSDAAIMPRLIECLRDDSGDRECESALREHPGKTDRFRVDRAL